MLRQALYWGDISLYFQPLNEFILHSLKHGEVPLWNPYVLCGQPLIGNPQSTVIYPTTLLLPFMPVWAFFTVDYACHLVFGGLGMYLFARRLCGDRLSGVMAALVFTGSGFIMARLQFPTMIQAAAYLPWLFLLADRLVERPGMGYASILSLVVALEVLAGHAQLAYMSFFAAIVYFLVRLYQIRTHTNRVQAAFCLGAGALILGIVATGAQILPMAQLFGLSTRERLSWVQANRFTLRWGDLINFLAPYWHGNPARGDYWGTGNLWESCVYVGIIPLVLALMVIARRIQRRSVLFFGSMAVVSLWLALGKFGGLFWIAFYLVPGLASFHDPARFTFITTFAVALLAALGLRSMRDRGWSGKSRSALVALSALNLWGFSAHLNPTISPSSFGYRPQFMASAPAMGEGRVFTAQRDRVWQRYLNYSDYGPDSARYVHELTDTVSPNIGMRFGVEEASGYEPVPLQAVTEVDAIVRTAMERKSPSLPNLLGLFNATAVLLPEMTRYRHPALQTVPVRGTNVLALKYPFARAWLVRRTYRVDGSRRALAALGAAEFDPRQMAIVTDSKGLDAAPSTLPVNPVQLERATETGLSLIVDAGPAPAYLFVSASWYPGWRATIDSRPTMIERANHAFRGVALPAGLHRVVFTYSPAPYRIGLFLTLVSCWAIVSGMVYGAVVRSRKKCEALPSPAAVLRGKRLAEV